jgi:hypothetical protein
MIHTLDDYICRSIDPEIIFTTNPNLKKKVDENGEFLPFIGNTVVFDLDNDVKDSLTKLQNELYARGCDVLSRRLDPSTFHMTLHDLVNGQPEDHKLCEKMAQVAPAVQNILSQWEHHEPISMKATWMFNMVNTSIVLGLKPADSDSCSRLDEMYCRLEAVLPLGYPLCPHITLAYFRPGQYLPQQIEGLCRSLRAVELELTLKAENLMLQNFRHMNCYY